MVRGFKVFEGSNGLFIKEPSERKEVEGETKYFASIGFPKDWYGRDAANPIFEEIEREYAAYKGKASTSQSATPKSNGSNNIVSVGSDDNMPF